MKKIFLLIALACTVNFGYAQNINRINQIKEQISNQYPTAKIEVISSNRIKTNYPKLTEKYRKELKTTTALDIYKSFKTWLNDSISGFQNEDCGYSANVVTYRLNDKRHNVVFYFDKNDSIVNSTFELSATKWKKLVLKEDAVH